MLDVMSSKKIELIRKNLESYPNGNSLNKELLLIERFGLQIIAIDDAQYPENLKNIYNPPGVLYVKGELLPEDFYSIAIVGSRRASLYGQDIALLLARQLAERSFTITSGMARGIDTHAHRGALKSGGRTIAVLGCGINIVYPPENESLIKEVSKSGAVISEFPINTPPHRQNFPIRNRIISGLSLGVVIVEAAQKSGSLITASLALEQGREVFSVPGRIDNPNSCGTLRLIKDGAKVVENVEDILEEIRTLPIDQKEKEKDRSKNIKLTEEENVVFSLISKEPRYLDDIKDGCDLDFAKFNKALLDLQLKKAIKELPGKKFVKT